MPPITGKEIQGSLPGKLVKGEETQQTRDTHCHHVSLGALEAIPTLWWSPKQKVVCKGVLNYNAKVIKGHCFLII